MLTTKIETVTVFNTAYKNGVCVFRIGAYCNCHLITDIEVVDQSVFVYTEIEDIKYLVETVIGLPLEIIYSLK
jgi:hypothetical protein